jgi:hypothetical protein
MHTFRAACERPFSYMYLMYLPGMMAVRRERKMAPKRFAIACVTLSFAAPVMADQGGGNQTVPGFDRPGAGFATSALPLGGFAIEQGLPSWSLDNEGGIRASQFMTDSLLRVGLGHGTELQVGSTPFNWLDQRMGGVSQSSSGRGDTLLGLKIAPPSSSQVWTWGVLGTVELPDGERGLRLPQKQYTLGVTVNQQWDDANTLGYFAQWQRTGNQGTYQFAGDLSHTLSKTWGIYAEAISLHQNGRSGGLMGAGVTYLPNVRLQWDLSFDRRFVGGGPTWMASFGVAFYFGP